MTLILTPATVTTASRPVTTRRTQLPLVFGAKTTTTTSSISLTAAATGAATLAAATPSTGMLTPA